MPQAVQEAAGSVLEVGVEAPGVNLGRDKLSGLGVVPGAETDDRPNPGGRQCGTSPESGHPDSRLRGGYP